MNEAHSNNKRIAKNTIMLYIRMVVMMLVSFYTTRITLQLLGVEDYGIKNVVTGIISFMSIITTAMVNASQRFLAFDLGKKDMDRFSRTFSTLINLFIIVSVVGVIVMEAIGPWFICYKLVIPEDRLLAAQWIFQFSVIGFVVSTMVIPFNSAVVACERMDVFAYISLLDAFLKLGVVYVLYITPFDKLITVVLLTVVAHFISNSLYVIYCRKKIEGCSYLRCWDKEILQKLSSFMGWNLFGSTTSVLNVQGQSILLNMFFGPIINAAKGISDTVNRFANLAVSNFYTAVSPQIVKTYANDEKEYTLRLVIYSTKLAFFLILIIGLPLINNMQPVLSLWLGEDKVTPEMVLFSQWTIVLVITQTFEYAITQTVRATGDIKTYQIVNGTIILTFLPLCYLAFKLNFPAITSMKILTTLTLVSLQYRIVKLSKILSVSFWEYYKRVIIPILMAVIPSCFLTMWLPVRNDTLLYLLLSLFISFVTTLLCAVILGMNKTERRFALSFIKKKKNN